MEQLFYLLMKTNVNLKYTQRNFFLNQAKKPDPCGFPHHKRTTLNLPISSKLRVFLLEERESQKEKMFTISPPNSSKHLLLN